MVQVGAGLGQNSIGSAGKNKSPSFHSNMSVDGMSANAAAIASPGSTNYALLTDEAALIKAYEDHWVYEKIVLERVK